MENKTLQEIRISSKIIANLNDIDKILYRVTCAEDNGPCIASIDMIGDGTDHFHAQCIVAMFLCLLNTSLLCLVTYLLRLLKKTRGNSVGIMLSKTLCIAEIFISLLSLLTFCFSIAPTTFPGALKFLHYMIYLIALLFTPVLYFAKIFISANEVRSRFREVLLVFLPLPAFFLPICLFVFVCWFTSLFLCFSVYLLVRLLRS